MGKLIHLTTMLWDTEKELVAQRQTVLDALPQNKPLRQVHIQRGLSFR